MPAVFTPVQIPLAHLTLSGWQLGDWSTTGPLLLCLHGWLDNADSFLPLAQALPPQLAQRHHAGIHLLAIDLAGHGQSEHRSAGAHYHFFDWVDDIVQLLRQFPNRDIHLIGHSMGGMIATAVAASFPELVKSLLLLDSFGLVTAAEAQTSDQLRRAILSRQQTRLKQAEHRQPRYADVAAAARVRQLHSDLDIASATILTRRGTVTADDGVHWSADLRLREVSAYRLSEAQARQLIRQVQAPVLAIVASDGIELVQQALNLWQDDYAKLQLIELTGGHHLHMTQSQAVAAIAAEFLDRQFMPG